MKKEIWEREEYNQAFKEADIVLADYEAFCFNISDPNLEQREKNIVEMGRWKTN